MVTPDVPLNWSDRAAARLFVFDVRFAFVELMSAMVGTLNADLAPAAVVAPVPPWLIPTTPLVAIFRVIVTMV